MRAETARLLEAFEALPEEEKRALTAELLRRSASLDFDAQWAARTTDTILQELGGRETVDARLRVGIAQLDRGEGVSEEDLDAHLARLKAEPE